MTAVIPPEALTAALEQWLDGNVAADAAHWREMARTAFLAGAAAERENLQAELATVRAAGTAAEREAREGRKAGAAAERDRIAAVVQPARLRLLADWFDTDDWFKVTMFPATWPERGHEVQDDLRAWADLLDGDRS